MLNAKLGPTNRSERDVTQEASMAWIVRSNPQKTPPTPGYGPVKMQFFAGCHTCHQCFTRYNSWKHADISEFAINFRSRKIPRYGRIAS